MESLHIEMHIEPFNDIVFFQLSQNGIYSKHTCHGSLLWHDTNI